MLTAIIQEFARRMESRELEITAQLTQDFDFSTLEAALNEECARLNAALQKAMLQALLADETFLSLLKQYAGRRGMRLKECRRISLMLSNGQKIEVDSPYFIKAKPSKQRCKKRGPNGSGEHTGLKVVGFIGRVSPALLRCPEPAEGSDATQTALLCPSYDVAATVLKGRGITLEVKALRRLCQKARNLDAELRGSISLSGKEELQGHTLVISADGGRLRERRRKRGRKAEHLKRQGYTSASLSAPPYRLAGTEAVHPLLTR